MECRQKVAVLLQSTLSPSFPELNVRVSDDVIVLSDPKNRIRVSQPGTVEAQPAEGDAVTIGSFVELCSVGFRKMRIESDAGVGENYELHCLDSEGSTEIVHTNLSKAEREKVLASELRSLRNVCVVPPESADGTPDYSSAGELAKVFRDYLNWEASVCTVEYHAGHTFNVNGVDRYDAYFEFERSENSWANSATWQSRSVTVVFVPLRSRQPVKGRWGYTNNLLFNPNELVGVAKKIKKSMGK